MAGAAAVLFTSGAAPLSARPPRPNPDTLAAGAYDDALATVESEDPRCDPQPPLSGQGIVTEHAAQRELSTRFAVLRRAPTRAELHFARSAPGLLGTVTYARSVRLVRTADHRPLILTAIRRPRRVATLPASCRARLRQQMAAQLRAPSPAVRRREAFYQRMYLAEHPTLVTASHQDSLLLSDPHAEGQGGPVTWPILRRRGLLEILHGRGTAEALAGVVPDGVARVAVRFGLRHRAQVLSGPVTDNVFHLHSRLALHGLTGREIWLSANGRVLVNMRETIIEVLIPPVA